VDGEHGAVMGKEAFGESIGAEEQGAIGLEELETLFSLASLVIFLVLTAIMSSMAIVIFTTMMLASMVFFIFTVVTTLFATLMVISILMFASLMGALRMLGTLLVIGADFSAEFNAGYSGDFMFSMGIFVVAAIAIPV